VPAYLQQGLTAIRNSIKALVTHVGVTDDGVAFSDVHTTLNPTGGSTSNYIGAATKTDVDYQTADYSFVVTSANFGNKFIRAIGVLSGSAATNALSRAVRTNAIGVEAANDTLTIAVRIKDQDATP